MSAEKPTEEVDLDATREAMAAASRAIDLPLHQRRDYLEMLGHISTKYMRAIGGDDYLRGWLEAVLKELDSPPMFELRKPQ